MIVTVPKEISAGERRVALVPSTVLQLIQSGLEVVVEAGAGGLSGYPDEDYESAGAKIAPSPEAAYGSGDIVVKVVAPAHNQAVGKHEVHLMKEGSTLISLLFPGSDLDLVGQLADRKIQSFAMELMPRIARAQAMDVLSSISSIAGYKAVLLAANLLPRYFPMMMTAAGTITPARVLVVGAGVAGLQAIATARRLGAVVEAFDIRPIVKEQVQSLGARFVDLPIDTADAQDAGGYAKEQSADRQAQIQTLLAEHVAKSDVVITTALVPGREAPRLVSGDMVKGMRAGSVIVDLAAEQGGNCEWTKPGEHVVREGVTIAGPLNLPSELAVHGSDTYSRNLLAYLKHLVHDGQLQVDLDDELTKTPLVTRNGEVVHEATLSAITTGER